MSMNVFQSVAQHMRTVMFKFRSFLLVCLFSLTHMEENNHNLIGSPGIFSVCSYIEAAFPILDRFTAPLVSQQILRRL
jgi:hypothetical protein